MKLAEALANKNPVFTPCGKHDEESDVYYFMSDWGPTEIACARCGTEIFRLESRAAGSRWQHVMTMEELDRMYPSQM